LWAPPPPPPPHPSRHTARCVAVWPFEPAIMGVRFRPKKEKKKEGDKTRDLSNALQVFAKKVTFPPPSKEKAKEKDDLGGFPKGRRSPVELSRRGGSVRYRTESGETRKKGKEKEEEEKEEEE